MHVINFDKCISSTYVYGIDFFYLVDQVKNKTKFMINFMKDSRTKNMRQTKIN